MMMCNSDAERCIFDDVFGWDLFCVAPRVPSRQEMVEAKVPLHYRDTCAGALIPLNECRRETLFLPWKCQELRHAYEKCQYEEWKTRVEILKNKQ
ncbi:hypothetical protein BBJ28_00008896 [Nothophytophthora sp. Chile5]|nr:hypothetical protein BBJ28_00008896 [Nothophytophthora sp. Chile5]